MTNKNPQHPEPIIESWADLIARLAQRLPPNPDSQRPSEPAGAAQAVPNPARYVKTSGEIARAGAGSTTAELQRLAREIKNDGLIKLRAARARLISSRERGHL